MLIREVQEGELAQCLQLQKLVWGFDRRDLVSAAMLNTCRKHGGLLLGAVVPEERMVGFVFAFPSWWENRLAQHSHMLAVLEEFRDQSIGYALKRAQYEDARSRRLALITWTFDPLEAKNAHLNLNKLGVCARRYYVNLYGERTSSELHSGLGTDRFLAEWRVGDEETEEILRRGKEEGVSWSLERVRSYPRAIEVMPGEEGLLEPVAVDLEIDASELLVEIPARIQEVKKKDLQVAMQWRLRTRQALTSYLSRGYEIGGLVKASDEFGLRTFYRVVTVQHRPFRAMRDGADMRIEKITLREIHLPLVHFFETSFGRVDERHVILVEAQADGMSGWGECVAEEGPFYSYETVDTAWSVLTRFLVSRVLNRDLQSPSEACVLFERIRGHAMAKASLEAALWDLQAQQKGVPLWKLLGGTREKIPCGVSIGIQDHPDALLRKIETELKSGYRKIKIKIKPGWDVDLVRRVRKEYPKIPLMVDANSAYTLADEEHLSRLDQFGLLMIEQPLSHDDIIEHGKLQARLRTPICLDESIRHARDAAHAIELRACRIINIKMGRVGGHTEARKVHDVCAEGKVPVWCGGMLETGIGRAHNIALSTLENFSIPGDVSASRRYFEKDTVVPPVEVTEEGYILAPREPGLGFKPDRPWIEKLTVRRVELE